MRHLPKRLLPLFALVPFVAQASPVRIELPLVCEGYAPDPQGRDWGYTYELRVPATTAGNSKSWVLLDEPTVTVGAGMGHEWVTYLENAPSQFVRGNREEVTFRVPAATHGLFVTITLGERDVPLVRFTHTLDSSGTTVTTDPQAEGFGCRVDVSSEGPRTL